MKPAQLKLGITLTSNNTEYNEIKNDCTVEEIIRIQLLEVLRILKPRIKMNSRITDE